MFRLAPQSSATTFNRRTARRTKCSPRGTQSPRSSSQALAQDGLTPLARSCPAMHDAACARATNSASASDWSVLMTPFMAPLVRRMRTSARVSMPAMPTMPCDDSHDDTSLHAR